MSGEVLKKIKKVMSVTSFWRLIIALLITAPTLLFQPVTGQAIQYSQDPATFLASYLKTMEGTRNSNLIKTSRDLGAIWDTGLNPTQRQQFISLYKTMESRGYRPGPATQLVVTNLLSLVNQQGDINGYLISLEQAAEVYEPKMFQQSLQTIRLVLEDKQLYQSNFNRLYLTAGQYRFRYDFPENKPAAPVSDGWDAPVGDSPQASAESLPVLSGLLIDLQNAGFAIVASGDSTVFGPSNGSVSLHNGLFVGNGGRFDWKTAGDSVVYVELKEFAFKTSQPALRAENAVIHDTRLINPVSGAFEYKSVKKTAGRPSTGFPRFISYKNDADLSRMNENLEYKGGYYLQGHELFSSSLSKIPSEIAVKFQGKIAFKATSQRFSLTPQKISSDLATFTLPLGADSIYHQGVVFNYDDELGFLHLTRPSKGEYAMLPYIDTYHKMYIWSESARWELAKEALQFYMVSGKTEIPLRMESMDYFRKSRLQEMSREFGFQPLMAAAAFLQQQKKQTFFPDELARFVKQQPAIVRRVLERLALEGYFDYHSDLDEYSLTRKGVFYIMANANKADFDNFTLRSVFPSNTDLANATVSMKDTLLTIRGVERFTISDSLKIIGTPSDRIVVMGRDRDFTMNGLLQSSNFKFSGRSLRFNYGEFFINMSDMDSITYVPQAKYAKGLGGEVGGNIRYEKAGTFYLSDAKNKSGQQKGVSGSPRIHIPEGVTVHFNQPQRGEWAYPEEVFFNVPELDVGGLDKRDIEFVGEFHSGNILPVIKTALKSMPDSSMGFEYTLPKDGLKIYEGRAVLKAPTLSMDYKGLQSKGTLNYLNGLIQADRMVMTSDSVIAVGKSARLSESTIGGVYFPKADLQDFSMKWVPGSDSMWLKTKENAVDFYNGTTKLEGELLLRSTGLNGSGILKRTDSQLESDNIQFKKGGFLAENAVLNVNAAKQGGESLLRARGVDIDFSIDKGIVQLSQKNEGFDQDSTGIEFPGANYHTTIGSATWDTKAQTIQMKSNQGQAVFRSLLEDQDGLAFTGSNGTYSIAKKEMTVAGVPFINSTGLNIIPDKGQVTIGSDGRLNEFRKARIVVDTLGISHHLYDAQIKIHSKNSLEGSAVYQYITASKDTFDIKLGNFELQHGQPAAAGSRRTERNSPSATEDTYYTTAFASIEESDKLRLAPGIAYKGDIRFASNKPSLDLDGYIRPMLKERESLQGSWIEYKETPGENITLKVDGNLKNAEGVALAAGLHYRYGSGIYPTFLSPKDDSREADFFAATGQMQYDGATKSFLITRKNTVDSLVPPTTVLAFDDSKGIFDFSGKIGFGSDEWILAAGMGQAQIDSMRIDVNTLLGLKFSALTPLLPDLASKIVSTNLQEHNNDPAEESVERLFEKLEAIIGSAATKAYADKLAAEHKPLSDASPMLNQPVVFSNVNLHWSQQHKSFYSSGRMGLSNLGTNDINAQTEGMIEIRMDGQQDGFTMLLEITPELWYFFDYADRMLGVVSSDYGFNDKVSATRSRARDMQLIPLAIEDKAAFVERFNTNYPKAARKPRIVRKPSKAADQKKEPTKKEEKAEGF